MFSSTKKLFRVLNQKQKKEIIGLAILMLVGGVIESVSVSFMLPLIEAVMNSDTWADVWYAKLICEVFHVTSQRNYIIVLLIILIFVFVLKNLYLLFEYYVQYGFACRSRYQLQQKLMHKYLHKPYSFYLNASSGEIVRIVTSDTNQFFSMLNNLLLFYTELVVAVTVGLTIAVISPQMALGVIIILLFEVLIIAKVIRPIMKKAGDIQRSEGAKANKWILQSVTGIKSVKVAHTEDFFERKCTSHIKGMVDADKKYLLFGNIPRLIIEAFTIAAVLFLVLIMVLLGTELSELIPQLSAFVVAAIRLLPSTNRISLVQNQIPFLEGGVDNIINVIDNETSSKQTLVFEGDDNSEFGNINFKDRVEFKDIVFAYPENEKNIFDHASFAIHRGESIGIVGASGAGKTTAVDILLGLLKPTDGHIYCDGIDIRENTAGWLSNVAYIPQSIFLMDDTIKANIAFGKRNDEIDERDVWAALKDAQLEEFVRGLPEGIYTKVGEQGVRLSGGQRQRIGIARALYNNPQILFFDEATSALDTETETAIMESINSLKGQKTMIIIAHRLSTIENCDVVYRVEDGKVIKER